MTTQTTSSTDSDTSIGELIARAADLKGELVAFAQSPRFARRLDTVLFETADRYGYLDEGTAVLAVDHFALQHRLSDGRTVLERFVAGRRPALSAAERKMLLGWSDVVEACFEVRRFDGDAVLLHNLLDDMVYRVYSNMGREAFAKLRAGMFIVGRIVPLHPATDAWLVTGHYSPFPKSARQRIASAAAEQITTHPELLRRNPAMLQRAWEIQAEHRADFIDQVGADLVLLPPHEAQESLREHYRRQQQRAMSGLDAKAARRAAKSALPDLGTLSEDLLEADSIAVIYDKVEGLTLYRNFGFLDDLFADPMLARDRSRLAALRSYLDDDSISPLAIRRLVDRHPDGADPVFRALLRKPGFSWQRDGENLLRRPQEILRRPRAHTQHLDCRRTPHRIAPHHAVAVLTPRRRFLPRPSRARDHRGGGCCGIVGGCRSWWTAVCGRGAVLALRRVGIPWRGWWLVIGSAPAGWSD
jgi:hypothetical protein